MEQEIYYKDYKRYYLGITILCAILGIIFLVYQLHPFHIAFQKGPCMLYSKYHLYCPGCMGTHSVIAFMELHFIKSFAFNPFVVLTAYLLIRYILEGAYTFFIKNDGKLHFKLSFKDIYICLTIFAIFVTVRDILLVLGIYDYTGYLIEFWR